jgi:hypothetical protein
MVEKKISRKAANDAVKTETKPTPTADDFDWRGATYTHVEPGVYEAVVKEVIAPEWIHLYRRWVVKMVFVLLDDGQTVPLFLNMGNVRKSPSIARNSAYREWWTAANGALPEAGEAMTPDVFTDDLIFRIEVADANLDHKKKHRAPDAIYSKVVRLESVVRRHAHASGSGSGSREHDKTKTSSSASSSGSRSPSSSPHKGGKRHEKESESSKEPDKTPHSASPRPGDGTHTQKATQKGEGFGSRSGKIALIHQQRQA